MKAAVRSLSKAIGRVLARKSARHATVICTMFALMVGGGAYMAQHSASLFMSTPKPPEVVARTDNITGAAGMKDDDPVKNFTRTGVGQVLFSEAGGESCKRTLFDNHTGSYRIVDDINCGTSGNQAVDDKKSEQLSSMRKAFNR